MLFAFFFRGAALWCGKTQLGFHRRWPILCHKIDVWIHHFGKCCARRGEKWDCHSTWPEKRRDAGVVVTVEALVKF